MAEREAAAGPAERPLPVHVVDDEPEVRESLALLLRSHGYEVALHASAEALLAALVAEPAAGCVVADVRMPGMDGLALQRELAARRDLPVLIVTAHGDVPMAVQAMRQGASDFIEKPYNPDQILDAVATAMALSLARRAAQLRAAAALARLALLSPRERDVFNQLVQGRSNRQVADVLGISVRTAEVHRARLMDKLALYDLPAMVRLSLDAAGA